MKYKPKPAEAPKRRNGRGLDQARGLRRLSDDDTYDDDASAYDVCTDYYGTGAETAQDENGEILEEL